MSARCGQAIEVVDVFGASSQRFMAQCGGNWLVINHQPGQPYNGLVVGGWQDVARQLIALAVPASLYPTNGRHARGIGTGSLFHDVPLSYPLSVSQLAGLLDEPPADVASLLDDLRVQAE